MDKNRIKSLLVERFEEACLAFEKRRQSYESKLQEELRELEKVWGAELVKTRLDSGIVTTTGRKHSEMPGDSRATGVKNRRRGKKSRRMSGVLRFTDLIPHIVEAVNHLQGGTFTVLDVRGYLTKNKVRFNPNHLYLIMKKYISGVRTVSKQYRSGKAMNIYEASGKITAVKPQ